MLDYSGHLLNLASRLMDLARPAGIVLDGAFGLELLDEETQRLFVAENVCIRSVAETEPTIVHVLKGVVHIPDDARHPISHEVWEEVRESRTFREWQPVSPGFIIALPKHPTRSDAVQVHLVYNPRRSGAVVEGVQAEHLLLAEDGDYRYAADANRPRILIAVDWLLDFRKKKRLRLDDQALVRITYVRDCCRTRPRI